MPDEQDCEEGEDSPGEIAAETSPEDEKKKKQSSLVKLMLSREEADRRGDATDSVSNADVRTLCNVTIYRGTYHIHSMADLRRQQ